MAIVIETTQINAKFLGGLALNKIMLGVIEIFPNIAGASAFSPPDIFAANDEGGWWDLSPIDTSALVLGAELNPQPDFNSAAGWTVGSNMNVAGGALNAQNTWATGQSSHALVLNRGKTYYVEVVVENFVGAGVFSVNMGNSPSADGSLRISGNGTFTAVLRNNTASAPERLQVGNLSPAGYTFSITRLSCKEVLSGFSPVLFQNAAATVLVTAVEQPLGLVVDKRKNLALGPDIMVNGDFSSSAGWNLEQGVTISGGTLNFTASNGTSAFRLNTGETGKLYDAEFDLISISQGGVRIALGNNFSPTYTTPGHYKVRMIAGSTAQRLWADGLTTAVCDNFTMREVLGNHRKQPTAAERPLWTFDTAQQRHGCKYNGVSNSMVTSNIDFTASDKMTACCGWLQPTTPTTQMVLELSNNVAANAGTFALYNENTFSINAARSGTPPGLSFVRSTTKTFPFVSVNTGIYDLGASVAANTARLRVNGVVDEFSNNLGITAGNFGNWPLSFGRRIGAGFVFGGTEFSSVVINRHLTAQELGDLETFSKGKAGVAP